MACTRLESAATGDIFPATVSNLRRTRWKVVETNELRWSVVSVLAAACVSMVSFALFLLFEYFGYYTDIPAFGTVTSSLAGGVVLWRRHPRTWPLVLGFYVPIMAVLLVVATIVIAGRLGYRFET